MHGYPTNRFDDFDATRPSTAPSPSDTLQTRAKPSFVSAKAANDATSSSNWLGFTDENSDKDDEFVLSTPKKTESIVTTPAKKTPQRSLVDELLDQDRLALNEKTVIKPTVNSSTKAQEFWLDQPTSSNNRPSTAGASRTTDFSTLKSATRSSYETKNDFRTSRFRHAPQESTLCFSCSGHVDEGFNLRTGTAKFHRLERHGHISQRSSIIGTVRLANRVYLF